MAKNKLAAVLAALSIGVASAAGAAAVSPGGMVKSQVAEARGMAKDVAAAAVSLFDEFEADHLAARNSRYRQAADEGFFAGPSVLISTKESGSLGMMLASLGLMGLIVHRRRSL